MRLEVAAPLNTDGIHLGRPPVGAPTGWRNHRAATQHPQPVFNAVAPRSPLWSSAAFGSMYFPGVKGVVQRDIPLLDTELPSANGVITARALARIWGDRQRWRDRRSALSVRRAGCHADWSPQPVARPKPHRPTGLSSRLPRSPIPGVLPGFGHVGLGGSFGWAIPDEGLAFSFVHNRLLYAPGGYGSAGFVGTGAPDPTWRRSGPQTRLHADRRVRLGVRPASVGAAVG